MKRLTQLTIAAAMLLSLCVPAAAQTTNVTYTWTAPTTGSTAVGYEVETSVDGGAFALYTTTTSPSAVVAVQALTTVIVRVRGVDSLGRKGPYSVNSDPYMNDPGPPGACGKPTRM
jgi:hypothetical protein